LSLQRRSETSGTTKTPKTNQNTYIFLLKRNLLS